MREGTVHDRTKKDGRVGECLRGATMEVGPELVKGLVQSLGVGWLREEGATIPWQVYLALCVRAGTGSHCE